MYKKILVIISLVAISLSYNSASSQDTPANETLKFEESILVCIQKKNETQTLLKKMQKNRKIGNWALGLGALSSTTGVTFGMGLLGGVPAMIANEILSSSAAGVSLSAFGLYQKHQNTLSEVEFLVSVLYAYEHIYELSIDLADSDYGSVITEFLSTCRRKGMTKNCNSFLDTLKNQMATGQLCNSGPNDIIDFYEAIKF